MKRLFATVAVLGVVIATVLFAQSGDRDEDGRQAEVSEKRRQVAEGEEIGELESVRARAGHEEAIRESEERVEQAEARRREDQQQGEDASLERKLVELNRIIEDLHRGGQRDEAEQLQRQAQEIVQLLRRGKTEVAAKQIESVFALQGPGPQRIERVIKRERAERADKDLPERPEGPESHDLAKAKRHVVELLAQGRRKEAQALEREIVEHLRNVEREAHARSVEARIHQLRESGKLEEAEDLAHELHEHLEREHHEARRREEHGGREEHAGREHREERVRHLREAAEHLHAAGFHEQAEDVMQTAERLVREHDLHAHAEHFERRMDELGEHVRHVAQRLERLEAFVEKLVDRYQDDDEDEDDDGDEDDDDDDDDDDDENVDIEDDDD